MMKSQNGCIDKVKENIIRVAFVSNELMNVQVAHYSAAIR